MIQAPNRNARLIRVIVTFTTTWELGYLFIITLLPQNFEPTATRPGIDPTAIVLDNVHSTEHVLVEYARSTASSSSSHQQGALFLSPHGLLNEVEGHGLEGDMAIGTQDNNRASEESKGDIDSQTERDQVLLGDPKEQTGEQLPQQKAFGDHQWNYQQPLEEFEGPDIGLLFEYPKTPDRGDNAAGHKNNDMEHLSMSTDQDPTSSDTTGGDSALQVKRANGVFVILTHEDELQKARETVRQIEDRFNRDRNYPWIVLTPLPLTTRSRNLISQLTKGTTTFGTIPHEQWRLPKWIEAAMVRNGDYAKMRLGMNKTSLLERHRWRYMSGFLAQHKLLDQYEFFWRVDPGVCILCDVEEDPMLMLKSSGQKFAWSLLSTVNEASVPGALSLIERFKSTHPELIPDSRDEAFLVREAGDAFTACTYGVETSIARVNFFRSPAYQAYFEYVDRQGPIYYHKWSDAAVTTIGLGLLAPRSDTLFLEHLGWSYGSIAYCPDRCPCNPQINNMALHLSCTPFWTELAESPELKRRLECNADGKCIMYVSKPNLTTVPDPK